MHLLLMLLALGLVAVNTFGAWAVSRRRPLVARLFLLAAAILTITAVAYAYRVDASWWLLLVGVVASFVASFLNALLVIGRVEWPNHVLRAAAFALLLFLARLPL